MVLSPLSDFPVSDAGEDRSVQDYLYTAISEHFPGGIIALLDNSMRIMMIGGAELGRHGLHPNRLHGSLLEDILDPPLYATIEPHYRRAMSGETVRFPLWYAGSDFTITATPVREQNGSIRTVLVVASETSGSAGTSNHEEEKRLNSERRFHSLVRHSSDLITILDASARVVYENPAFTQIFGNSGAGRDFTGLLHPGDLPAFHRHFRQALHTQDTPLCFEARYRRADGSQICLESVVTNLLGDPDVQGVVINSRDISERKRTERRMRDFNDLLMGIMESTETSIYSLDRELRYTAFSSAHREVIRKIFGVDIELGRAITDYLPEGGQSEALLREFHRALAGERRTLNISYGAEPLPTFIEVLINPIRDEQGAVSGIAVFINNTTERELAQRQLSRANEELDTRVRERTADLQQALEQLNTALSREKELNELKTRFVSMISHEFRTPLTSILSSVEILDRYRDRLGSDQQKRFYFMITESVHRMSTLLSDVILLGRAESNQLHYNPMQLNPDQYCRELLAELQAGILKDRTIEYSMQGTMREVLVDPHLLRYILVNLLSNAAKYSPELEPVSLSATLEAGSITFRVSDRGIGITPEDLQYIYEPFYRSGQVETIPGTGLGLSIVRQSVAHHGGTVGVETGDKDGTTFTVTIPA